MQRSIVLIVPEVLLVFLGFCADFSFKILVFLVKKRFHPLFLFQIQNIGQKRLEESTLISYEIN